VEQRHVERLGQFRTAHGARGRLLQRRMNVHLFMDILDGFGGQAAGEQLLEMGHFRLVIDRENWIFDSFSAMHKGSISMNA
jgi:hypothetical protein